MTDRVRPLINWEQEGDGVCCALIRHNQHHRERFGRYPRLFRGGSLIKSHHELHGFQMSAVKGQVTRICQRLEEFAEGWYWFYALVRTDFDLLFVNQMSITLCVIKYVLEIGTNRISKRT